jgi:hypothetical protein
LEEIIRVGKKGVVVGGEEKKNKLVSFSSPF